MNLKQLFVLILIFSCFSVIYAGPVYLSVNNFGAKGDGTTVDTKAIQQAIDKANEQGGGTVYFPAGTYLSGTIVFKSHVSLYLEAGATVLGSTNQDDYPVIICDYRSYTDNYTVRSLLYAEKVENISILGRGTIDGQGSVFKDRRTKENPYKDRPYMIRMIECKDITVRDVTIINSPMWVQHYLACDDILIDGITVSSVVASNNDGIDIDSCHRVRISNCDIYSGDDAIVLKATSARACEDITVTNCVLSSECNAFKLGTESNGGFQNITFSNSTVYDTRLSAIALEMVDGGLLERVTVDNIVVKNVGNAIFVRLGNRARPFLSKGPGGGSGTWERRPELERPGMGALCKVVISNVLGVGIGPVGCSITGLPGHNVEDITLQNINLECTGGGTAELIDREIPENEEKYPEFKMFGDLPSYGFYVRHVDDIKFDNIELSYKNDDARPGFIFDDVKNLDIQDVDGELDSNAPAFMLLKNVNGGFIHGCRPTHKMKVFASKKSSQGVTVMNNDFANVSTAVKE